MNADGLSRIAMSSGLAASLSRATEYARAQGHGEVTLEHILLALCDDPDAVLVLAASNVNLSELTTEIGRHLSALPTRPQGPERDLMVAGDLKRILEAAAAAARGGRRREINGAIVLAAIIGDGKSAAAHVLSSQGLTFEAAIRALQSKPAAAPEPPTAPPARPLPQPDAESILASARERVQSRTGGRPAHREEVHEEPELESHEAGEDHYEGEEGEGEDFERREPHFEPEPVPRTAPPAAAPPMTHRQPPPAAPVNPPAPPAMREPAFQPPPPPVTQPVEPRAREGASTPAYEPQHREPTRAPYGQNEYAPEPYEEQARYDQANYGNQADYGQDESFAAPDYDEGGYAEREQRHRGYAPPPSMPASPPFPPPVPMPSPHEGWAPPPTPDAVAERPPYPARPPMPREAYAPAPMPPRAPGGPPPLAPWPEPERPVAAQSFPGGASPPGFQANRQAPPQMQRPGSRHPAPRAEIGQLVENIPRSMRVAVPAMIEVRIARADVKALAEGLQGGGAAYQHDVAITKAMSVRLRAPDGGFFIETASPETQWIERSALLSEDDFASWRWHVTPRDAGRKRLQLIISARTMSADGMVAETALPDQVITVRVRTNYGQVASRWIGWGVAAVAGGLLAKFGEGAFAMLGKMISG